MDEIVFPRHPSSRTAERLGCPEAVAAHWRTAVASLGTRSLQLFVAHLRRAIAEAGGDGQAGLRLRDLDWDDRRARALELLLRPDDPPRLPDDLSDTWLLLEATFDAIRLLVSDETG